MILKTYARAFTNDIAKTLPLLEKLVGRGPDLRFLVPELGLEIAAIGDFCVVAGTPEVLAPILSTVGPVVVDDLQATKTILLESGAEITMQDAESESGRFFYARHPDGLHVEYVQWKPEIVKQIIG